MIFVGDGRKALFLRNDGDEKFPNLKTEQVFADENPPTHEQGTDKPGCRPSGVLGKLGSHIMARTNAESGTWVCELPLRAQSADRPQP